MANTYTLIASTTVGAGGASSIDFTSIPSTYTDLVVKHSTRYTSNGDGSVYLQFNGDTGSNYNDRMLYGDPFASSAGSVSNTNRTFSYAGSVNFSTMTANTFSSNEIYIPNYTSSNSKSYSVDGVSETNGAQAYEVMVAGRWSGTSTITSIKIFPASGTFVQYSTATLYGIKNS